MQTFDSLVIGGGIGGMQSALDLADQGYKVLLIEKKPSIGGKMIQLSKVFPTLDCASCITAPKMSAVMHHPNITVWTDSELLKLDREGDTYKARILKHTRYVHMELCTACGQCEEVCPVEIPSDHEQGLGIMRAVGVPFSNALPQKAKLLVEYCVFCGKCERVCPTKAIDYTLQDEEVEIHADTVIIATGFELTDLSVKKEWGYGKYPNVITSMQMERILAPHGPYGGVLRPSDGKVPGSIAYVQCAGSRDVSLGKPYCSRVCCMYAIKQAMLLSGAVPLADITIYYMDIRAFGKNYEEFYQSAKAMGINFIKAKVAKITEIENHDLKVHVEVIGEDGGKEEYIHDLVVLSNGLSPGWDPEGVIDIEKDDFGFMKSASPKMSVPSTKIPGIYVVGTAAGPKDIPDTIVEAGAGAMRAGIYLAELKAKRTGQKSAKIPLPTTE